MTTHHPESSVWKVRSGWAATALVAVAMLGSAAMKLSHAEQGVAMFTGKFGYSEDLLNILGVLEASITVIYLIPRTRVLGAILLTGYLGGAIATHVRVGDVFIPPLVLGILVWAGLYLRDRRVQALLPLTPADK